MFAAGLLALLLTVPATKGSGPAEAAPPVERKLPGAPVQGLRSAVTPSGLQYFELKVGSGAAPEEGDTVTVHYTGWLLGGQLFDTSRDDGSPFRFPLGRGAVIAGWDEGVAGMRVGGRRKLVIPPSLGYGDRGAGAKVPPGATLVFDVELLAIERPGAVTKKPPIPEGSRLTHISNQTLDPESPVRGTAFARVRIVEFGDYECPFTQKAEKTLAALRAKYGTVLAVEWHDAPLAFHPHALAAARAALAAGRQGAYWEMHDLLLVHQSALTDQDLERYASQLGLGLKHFQEDRTSPAVEDQLARDRKLVEKMEVKGTPTFFINGHRLNGAQPQAKFEELIDAELSR